MSQTILYADAVITMNKGYQIFEPGCVVIEEGQIIDVREADKKPVGNNVIDLSGHVLMPGLVNAHTHTPMSLFRGIAEGHSLFTFDGWFNSIRVVEQVADSSMVPDAVTVSCAEMIRTGTTCFADQYFYMDKVLPVVRQSGMRAGLAYGIVELGDETSRKRELASATAFLESVGEDPRIRAWVGPHAFFVDNSPEAMKIEMEIAKRFKTGFHIHQATSGEEDRFCQEHYQCSAVQQMKKVGILDFPVIAAHCNTVPEEDFPILAQYPFTAVICPSASMRSAADPAALKAMRKAGVNTALGTDNIANCNSYDLFSEMGTASKLMALREHTPAAVPSRDIVEMATMGGARALQLEKKIGSLEAGKRADIIALNLNTVGWCPRAAQDLYTALVYSVSGMHVSDVMVDGEWLLRNEKWTTLDYVSASNGLNQIFVELKKRIK